MFSHRDTQGIPFPKILESVKNLFSFAKSLFSLSLPKCFCALDSVENRVFLHKNSQRDTSVLTGNKIWNNHTENPFLRATFLFRQNYRHIHTLLHLFWFTCLLSLLSFHFQSKMQNSSSQKRLLNDACSTESAEIWASSHQKNISTYNLSVNRIKSIPPYVSYVLPQLSMSCAFFISPKKSLLQKNTDKIWFSIKNKSRKSRK